MGLYLDSAQAPRLHTHWELVQQGRPPHLLPLATSCKVAELLADFLIYLYASPWTGKGKGKVLISGVFLSFPNTAFLWWPVSLATQAVFTSTGGATHTPFTKCRVLP